MSNNSDYNKPRTNLYDLLPEVYKSGVNRSVLETTIDRFLTKSETDRIIGYIGQGNPNALIKRQLPEPTPQRQAYQLQPMIYSKIGTVEHMASWKDIENELERLGVDPLLMQQWGDALAFNWAPPIDYDKLINYRNYYWYNPDDPSDAPQYLTIQNRCNRAQARLDEFDRLVTSIGSTFNIVGLDALNNIFQIEDDLTSNFVEGFIFYVKDSTNTTINNEFFTVVSSSYTAGSNTTNIVVNVTGSPAFSDTIVDGVVSLDETRGIYETARDCACNGSVGWDGGLWDDNQIGIVLWNTQLIQDISYSTEAAWIAANCGGSPCPDTDEYHLWYDTSTDELKQSTSPGTWVIVQRNFSALLSVTTGGELWDFSSQCQFSTNEWIEQNMWLHQNQVPNFSSAKQAQIPIIEFLPDVELNEWTQVTYDWRYRPAATEPWVDALEATPNLFELIGVDTYTISGTKFLIFDARYGDLTETLTPGTEFDITGSTDNDGRYTVDYSLFDEEVSGQKFQTRVHIVETLTSATADGIVTPATTSRGDDYEGVYVHWVYVAQSEAFPVGHLPLNPMLKLPTNPPLTPTVETYWESTLGLFAQELLITTKSLGELTIIGASSGSPTYWEVAGNHVAALSDPNLVGVGGTITVQGNTGGGSDDYTITSVTLVGSNTRIGIAESISAAAASASTLGTLFAHWTFTFDSTLRDETLVDTNDLRVYLETVRQYGNYDEISVGGSPTPSCDYVGGILIRAPIEQYETLLVEVGAAACCDLGYNWVGVRTDENDGTFNPATDLSCVSLIRYKKLEQVKTNTNQYPLFDLYDVEGNTLNEASRIFGFQESQDYPINTLVNKRIVSSTTGREYYFEQFLSPEDNGILYAYRSTSSNFWFDPDGSALYEWKNETWNPKILTSEFASSASSKVYYIAPIISDTAPASPYIGIDGMLWYNTANDTIYISNGVAWTASSFYTSAVTKSDADPGLNTIWRTGPTDATCVDSETYVPSWVDGDRNALTVGDPDGDWEIPDQLYYNPLHENRKILSYTDLYTHFTSIISSQTTPPGFLGSSADLFHAILDINFGAGGTIKEFNYSYDTFISAIFNQTVNPPQLYEFAHDAYESALSSLKEFFRRDIQTLLLDTDPYAIADLSGAITDYIIAQYETNDAANVVFGDTTAYDADTGLGVKNWPATLPFLNLVHKVKPQQIYDTNIGFNEILHHDGHYSHIEFNPTTIEVINRRVIASTDSRSSNPTGKMGTSATMAPPDLFTTYQTQFGNTSGIYWYDVSDSTNRILYRMSAVAVGTIAPSVDLAEGAFWYDTSANQLKILQSGSWVADPSVGAGYLSDIGAGYYGAWEAITLDKFFSNTILEVETRLWEAAPTTTSLAFDFDATFAEDAVLTDQYFEEAFVSYLAQAEITDPYTNEEYLSSDPYTWNYKTAVTPGTLPRIGSTYVTGGTWQDVYQKNLGTPYPHFEPWRLQGYDMEPNWWTTAYPSTAGRRWSEAMWDAILAGDIPAGELLPNGDLSTGAGGEVAGYNYIPVNMNNATVTDGMGYEYESDALLPPVTVLPVIPVTRPVRSLWTSSMDVPNREDDYNYDDAGLVEWTWENASQYLYDTLKVAFRLQPIRFIHYTLGVDFIYVGCLNVDQVAQKVYAHQNTLFHGDLLPDNTVYKAPGTLQWYTNFNRFNGYDTSASNFRDMWSGWDTYLAYQFSAVIDTDSFLISNNVFDMVETDFDITIKRSPGIENHEIDALNVAVIQSAPSFIGQDTRSQWIFDVNSFSTHGRPMPYYGTQTYNFTVDSSPDIFTTSDVHGRNMPWEDGQAVYVSSTEFLPSPLLPNTVYYVNKVGTNKFKLSEQKGGPVIDILSPGTGTHSVFQVASTFTALQGATTSAIWYHVELDKSLVLIALPPARITGFQQLISFIDGYAAYASDVDNFRFNHYATDIDADTGMVVNWQLEEERLINWAYSTREGNRTRRDKYSIAVDSSTDTFTFTGQIPGGWITGQAVNVKVESGGVLPEPLLPNVTYYLIQTDTSGVFQLAITARNARNAVAIDMLTNGTGDVYMQQAITAATAPTFEVNPFRYNLWIDTPQGVVSDLERGPFADIKSEHLLLDQYGRQLPFDKITPLRQDKLTQIKIAGDIANDVSPFVSADLAPYNTLHLTSAHIYIDGYEHVILFSDYASSGYVIYDSFLGLNASRFDVQMDRGDETTLRPNLGGFVLVDNRNTTGTSSFSRNIEGQVDDLRYAYDTYRTVESNLLTAEARKALGYDGPKDYLNSININPKSQFIFWRGMIQQKGSVNSVKAFINSRRFVDAKIDEYWARKVADFGSTDEYSLPELNLFGSDGDLKEFRIEFLDPNEVADTGFIGITSIDDTRWYHYPEQKAFFDANGNMYFNAEATSVDTSPTIDAVGSPAEYYYRTNEVMDTIVVTYYGASPEGTIRLVEGVDYTIINSRLVKFTSNPAHLTDLKIYTINPAHQRHNPIKIRDAVDDLTVSPVVLWDPARGHHYYQAFHLVDIQGDGDPALINYGYSNSEDPAQLAVGSPIDYPYGSNVVNTTWLDTSHLAYVPYSDIQVFPDIYDRLRRWGNLADFASYDMYQWTESTVPPSEYNALAEEQEGDITIDERDRVNGRVREVVYEGDGGSPIAWSEYPYEVAYYPSRLFYVAPSFTISSTRPATLYQNGVEVASYTSSAAIDTALSSFADEDHIHVVKYYPTAADIDNVNFKVDTPYTIEQKVVNGEPTTLYYFWVGSKTVRQTYRNKSVTMVEAEQQLDSVPIPYAIVQKFNTTGSPDVTHIPRQYTQCVVRGLSNYVNEDDRYTLRFTRDFTYRDNLSTPDLLYGPDSVKVRHQEWKLFRQEQPFTIDRVLWNALTEAIIGQTIASLGSTAVRVPSLDKELYDDENNTATRIGFSDGQAFCDGTDGWNAVLAYLQDGANDFSPIDINTFFETYDPLSLTPQDATDAQTIANMMDEIYNTFSYEDVNRMWFSTLLTAALPIQHQYKDLLKTSYVALHGIRILETEGLYDD